MQNLHVIFCFQESYLRPNSRETGVYFRDGDAGGGCYQLSPHLLCLQHVVLSRSGMLCSQEERPGSQRGQDRPLFQKAVQ
jgi:hypothetical protein